MEIVPYCRRQIIIELAPKCLYDAELLTTSYPQYPEVILSLSLIINGLWTRPWIL